MDTRRRFLILLLVWTAVLSLVFGTLHVVRFRGEMERQLADRARLFSNAFGEQTAIYLATNQQQNLDTLTEMIVQGGVLYAQVVIGGEVVAETATPEAVNALPAVDTPGERMTVQRWHPPGGPIMLDVVQALFDPQESSTPDYVRLGISLADVQNEANRSILWSGGLGALALLVAAIAGTFLAKGFETDPKEIPQVSTVPDTANDALDALANGGVYRVGSLSIDDRRKEVRVDDRPIQLTQKEFELLKFLASEGEKVFSQREIKEAVWPEGTIMADDVKKYIYFLRQKIETDPSHPEIVLTVKGFGYRLGN